jgi:alpha-mannosidase
MSTPGRYVEALKAENVTWPVYYDDFLNYYENKGKNEQSDFEFWSGYYTSRPGFKKQIKDASSQYYS